MPGLQRSLPGRPERSGMFAGKRPGMVGRLCSAATPTATLSRPVSAIDDRGSGGGSQSPRMPARRARRRRMPAVRPRRHDASARQRRRLRKGLRRVPQLPAIGWEQAGYTCDATLCTDECNDRDLLSPACADSPVRHLGNRQSRNRGSAAVAARASYANGTRAKTNNAISALNAHQRDRGIKPQCDINGTLCGTP